MKGDDQGSACRLVAQLYDEYGDRLYRIAYGMLRNRVDAEDAVQDVFVKAMGKMPDFESAGLTDQEDPKERQWRWLVRVTMNQCRDSLRRQKVRVYTPLEEVAETLKGAEEDPAVRNRRQMGEAVLAATLALPEKYKAPMMLHYLEGFSVEEVSKILEIGRSAVKMRLARGREMVKRQMEGDADIGRQGV